MFKIKLLIFISAFFITTMAMAQTPEDKLKELNIELPEPTKPVANYVKAVRSGNLLFLSGHGTSMKGKLGKDLNITQGQAAARETAISLISTTKAYLGDLSKVKRIVKVTGMVNSDPEFYDQPKVINGCSDLLVAVFGDKGKHARAAVGMVSLPSNIAVEIEMIVEIEE